MNRSNLIAFIKSLMDHADETTHYVEHWAEVKYGFKADWDALQKQGNEIIEQLKQEQTP